MHAGTCTHIMLTQHACKPIITFIYYMNCEMLFKKALYHHAFHSDAKGKVIKLYDSIS